MKIYPEMLCVHCRILAVRISGLLMRPVCRCCVCWFDLRRGAEKVTNEAMESTRRWDE